MTLSKSDIINFISTWKTNNDYAVNDEEIAVFIKELQNQISQMDYSVPNEQQLLHTQENLIIQI